MTAGTAMLREGRAGDLDAVKGLLERCGLPASDLGPEHLPDFLVAEAQDRIVATAGVQPFGLDGVLRSVAVEAGWRGVGLAAQLVAAIERRAAQEGVQRLWLLTTSASDYFSRLGYRPAARDEAPAAVRGCVQFASLCPASATCLAKTIG